MEILIPIAAVIVFVVLSGFPSQIDVGHTEQLPGGPSFSEEAMVEIDDGTLASVNFWDTETGVVHIHARAYGTATITVTDGGEVFRYTLEVYREDGNVEMRVTPSGQ